MIACTVEGPHSKSGFVTRGMCNRHYRQWLRQNPPPWRPRLLHEEGPPICVCATAVADGIGQCVECWHPILSLHPRLISGLRIWPQLADQTVTPATRHVA